MSEKWSEATIGRAVSKSFFKAANLVVPCCGWTGHECDLLVITKDLRIIDVEIKISRADLKADLAKDKWWHARHWSRRAYLGGKMPDARTRRDWPPKVWKHYYMMPDDIWSDELLPHLPATSGVILLARHAADVRFAIIRASKPNRQAECISPADAIDIARLANLRMWDALHKQDHSTKKEPS